MYGKAYYDHLQSNAVGQKTRTRPGNAPYVRTHEVEYQLDVFACTYIFGKRTIFTW